MKNKFFQNVILYIRCLPLLLPKIILLYLMSTLALIVTGVVNELTKHNNYINFISLFALIFVIYKVFKAVFTRYSRNRRYATIGIYVATETDGSIPHKIHKTGIALGKQVSSQKEGIVGILWGYLKWSINKTFKRKSEEELLRTRRKMRTKLKVYGSRLFFDIVPFYGPCSIAGAYIKPGKPLYDYIVNIFKERKKIFKELFSKWIKRFIICAVIVIIYSLWEYLSARAEILSKGYEGLDRQMQLIILYVMGIKENDMFSYEERIALWYTVMDLVLLVLPLLRPVMDMPLTRAFTRYCLDRENDNGKDKTPT